MRWTASRVNEVGLLYLVYGGPVLYPADCNSLGCEIFPIINTNSFAPCCIGRISLRNLYQRYEKSPKVLSFASIELEYMDEFLGGEENYEFVS